ncbi:MAG TPA: CHAT domain-containing tetratricopeptide repeat protein [Candidatus Acidoferrum sp.]|nr:CHAT domain-containing tetratricopeptide repeat protein [Candidatus Acidoferrum sp.]
MKARPRNWLAPVLCTGVFLLTHTTPTWAQQPVPPPTSSPLASQAQSAPTNDLAAQEDELIKKCNDQMNVKGQFKEAEETAKQALALSEKMGDKKRIMVALMYLGSAYAYEGNELEALEIFKRTADLARETGNRKGLSRALNNISGVLGNLGRYEESLSYMYQCMDVARELGDLPMQYTVLTNIGSLYMATGDPDKAEAPLQESLRIGRDLKHSDLVSNPSKVATEKSLILLGGMASAREHYQAALKYFDQVRESQPDSAQTQVELLNSMAFVHQRLGEYQKAEELFQKAIPIAEKANTADLATLIVNLGETQESLGQFNEALASEDRALAVLRKIGAIPDSAWQAEQRIGHIDRALGRMEEALAHYETSIHAIEHLRVVGLNTEAGRAGFGSLSRSVYDETADLLYNMHHEPEALEMAERGRARAFLDMLAFSRTGLAEDLTPEQRKREDEILAHISSVQKNLWKENTPAEEEKRLKAQLTSAENDLEAFHVSVRQSNPRYASVQYTEPIIVGLIQKHLLDDRTVLLEFLLGEKRSLVWTVSKQKLSVAVLPPRKEIEAEVAAYRKLLTDKTSALTLQSALSEIQRRGKHLYASLLQPVANAIPPGSSLLIVPDGNLGYLPFESLIAGSRRTSSGELQSLYLLDKFAIAYAPSASALAAVREANTKIQDRPKMLLAFGDPIAQTESAVAKNAPANGATRSPETEQVPSAQKTDSSTTQPSIPSATDSPATPAPSAVPMAVSAEYAERGFSLSRLPFTRDEVLGISKLYPASQRQIYLGEDAREETVKSEKLDLYRYIHFASHGFIDESHPDRSGILFSRAPNSSEDGVLQMGEIMRLKLNADLVTLSACSTGLGKLVNGEGILGLTRAFFYAGARNVTVSLWNVNDSATATLMKYFYVNLNRGLPKNAALRQAKLSLLHSQNPLWRHPYFWAAFVLVGEGK